MLKVKYKGKVYDAIVYPEEGMNYLYQIYNNEQKFREGMAVTNYNSEVYRYAVNINKSRCEVLHKIYLGGE